MKPQTLISKAAPAITALILTTTAQEAPAAPEKNLGLTVIGTYASGIYDAAAAETVVHDPATQWLYVVNASTGGVDVLSIADPAQPVKLGSIGLAQVPPLQYGSPRGLAVRDGVIAVSFEAIPKTSPGIVVLLVAAFDGGRPAGDQIVVPDHRQVTVGALPDMLTFTPNGRFVLVANEGEPNSYNDVGAEVNGPSVDPQGSVSIIDLSGGVAGLTQDDVRDADFTSYDGHEAALRAQGIRIYGPNASASVDLEPEYITISQDSSTAWVTLQENNAIATIDIESGAVTKLLPLGLKDHSRSDNGFGSGNGLDASERDAGNNILNWPVKGMYQPDAIAAYSFRGKQYLVTANEGDVRSYPGLLPPPASGSEDIRVGSLALDPADFPDATALKALSKLGRLQASRISGDLDGDGLHDEIHTFGGRSFSIWSTSGDLVFDSGDQFERITAQELPLTFNTNSTNNDRDGRSDDSGPEPECLVLGRAFGRQWAFIGLERVGGIMVYDVTDPREVRFSNYVNNRNFSVTPNAANIPPAQLPNTGDLSPEALVFINEEDSPTGQPLLVVTNAVSGTTTVFGITKEN